MLAEMDSSTEREVHVRLLDEGTLVYRPTIGIHQEGNVYLLKEPPGYDPEDEHWEFIPGSFVRCEERSSQDGFLLVASELVSGPGKPR